jgi:hypothetical protein
MENCFAQVWVGSILSGAQKKEAMELSADGVGLAVLAAKGVLLVGVDGVPVGEMEGQSRFGETDTRRTTHFFEWLTG